LKSYENKRFEQYDSQQEQFRHNELIKEIKSLKRQFSHQTTTNVKGEFKADGKELKVVLDRANKGFQE
jgi:hypothetical protein